jgi:hypothetical protein
MNDWMKTAIVGFIAGALSVFIFHQAGFFIMKELKFLPTVRLYNMAGVPPWGVPAIISAAFWGGLWGIVGAFLIERLPGQLKGWLGWVLFAAIVVTLVNWFVVAPLKNQPTGYGFRMNGVWVVPVVYAIWGFGMWLLVRVQRRAFGWP